MNNHNITNCAWIPLGRSLRMLVSRKRLMGISFLLFLATAILTWFAYQFCLDFVDTLVNHTFSENQPSSTIFGWLKFKLILGVEWLYLIVSRIVGFYLAFMVAYSLTSPGYVLLSTSAEKLHAGDYFVADNGYSLKIFAIDLWEGIKIGILGLLVSPVVLLVNFIPIVGQVIGFIFFTYYSALLFVDYPSSRRGWSLGKKIKWLRSHSRVGFRLGLIPAVISMIPVLNIFFMAILFPLLTIHTTLNFTDIEWHNRAK